MFRISTVFPETSASTDKVGQTWLTSETQPRPRTSWVAQPGASAMLSLSQDTFEGGGVVTDGAAEPRVIVFHHVFFISLLSETTQSQICLFHSKPRRWSLKWNHTGWDAMGSVIWLRFNESRSLVHSLRVPKNLVFFSQLELLRA